ncbi:macrophage-expressed gene 1 protein-like [Mercenaria mercenaria]|uniref:macrophage-expressed gene 1 protein-like n=1 Tax=Mercenaria mercenaria TaxID=6596 RepID=UPI00234F234D|nr:macrophage-expressed gene 1 protein-like [Mercenaria mercenaria]
MLDFKTVVTVLLLYGYVSAEDKEVPEKEELTSDLVPDGHPLKCMKIMGEKVKVFEVLPGIGWDNIQNTELSQVLSKNYFQCKLTEDGRYLIPDNVLLIPIKQSHVDLFAEWIESMHEYKSVDSFSVNGGRSVSVGIDGLGVSGSFSAGYQSAKSHMSKTTTSNFISRVQARYNRYRIVSDPNAGLHPSFKDRLLEIAESFFNNHVHIAEYQCQLLIRDFGTHVLTSMDAGAVLFKEDHIDVKTSTVDDIKRKQWQIGAGASFAIMFDGVTVGSGLTFGISKSKMEENINEYNSNISYSVIRSFGGDYFGGNTTGVEWTKTLDNELVPIDRNGVPVYELISSSTLPELPLDTILKVGQGVKNAFISYYKHNTYRGCMDPRNKNYDIKANVVDESVCGGIKNENEYFGGVYQTCIMSQTDAGDLCKDKGYIQKNPLTSDFSCPKGYTVVELISIPISFSKYSMHRSKHWPHTHHGWTDYSFGRYTAFWCAPDHSISPDQKYFFGGVYSSFRSNAITGGQSCPAEFIPLRLGEDIYVCVSSDENVNGLKFGGLFSCYYGNPLALTLNTNKTNIKIEHKSFSSYPKSCPQGFARQTFSIISECELDYCSEAVAQGKTQELPILKRPPYINRPKVPPANFSDMVIVVDGKWYKNEAAFKKMIEMETLEAKIKEYKKALEAMDRVSAAVADLYGDRNVSTGQDHPTADHPFNALPSYAIALISSLATLICVVVATIAFIKCRKKIQERNLPTRLIGRTDEMEQVRTDDGSSYGSAEGHHDQTNAVI